MCRAVSRDKPLRDSRNSCRRVLLAGHHHDRSVFASLLGNSQTTARLREASGIAGRSVTVLVEARRSQLPLLSASASSYASRRHLLAAIRSLATT